MTKYSNNQGISLAGAVWLAHDDYDYVDDENYISVTTLIKPVRQIILGERMQRVKEKSEEKILTDISDLFRSRLGQTVHSGVENTWKKNYRTSMAALGYPEKVIDRIRINPEVEEPGTLPVYLEERAKKEIDGFVIGGKVDLIIDSQLHDVKLTSTYAYISKRASGNWRLQGSLYRWLNPEKIRNDELLIQYLLTDWSGAARKRDPDHYPSHPTPVGRIGLMGFAETEQWVRNQLRLLRQYSDSPEELIPECSDEDLWRSDPVWKYYKNPEKTKRATKNFDNLLEANSYLASQGHVGVVKEFPGLVRACNYCPAAPICSQYQRLLAEGQIAS